MESTHAYSSIDVCIFVVKFALWPGARRGQAAVCSRQAAGRDLKAQVAFGMFWGRQELSKILTDLVQKWRFGRRGVPK